MNRLRSAWPVRPRIRAHRGQSLVELALATPIVLALVAGGVDLARLYFAGNEVADAAREGGLYASHHPGYTQSSVQNVVNNAIGSGAFSCQSPAVTLASPSPGPVANTYEQQVTVSCSLPLLMRFLPVSNPLTLTSTVDVYVCPTPTPATPAPTPRPC